MKEKQLRNSLSRTVRNSGGRSENLGLPVKPIHFIRDHPYITSVKDWVGGSRKLSDLLTFSTALGGWVIKVQNYADVIIR